MLRSTAAALLLAPTLAVAATASPNLKASYLYDLANFSGVIRDGAAGLAYDPSGKELLLFGNGIVRTFDSNGMEVHQFGDDVAEGYGNVLAAAAMENGDLVALSYDQGGAVLTRRNFRGEPISRIDPKGVPAPYAGFGPNILRYANGRIYLVSTGTMQVLVLNADGTYVDAIDLKARIELNDKETDTEMNGFAVDADGSILFTVATLFKAFVVSPDGIIRSWGRPGGAPGRFNVTAGIGADATRYFVLDALKSAVIVFDKKFNFLGEFGGFGKKPGQLYGAMTMAVGGGRVYVSQMGGRGTAVYQVSGG
jgi:hypothetical protein